MFGNWLLVESNLKKKKKKSLLKESLKNKKNEIGLLSVFLLVWQ